MNFVVTIKACSYADRYSGQLPPLCNAGNPCMTCELKRIKYLRKKKKVRKNVMDHADKDLIEGCEDQILKVEEEMHPTSFPIHPAMKMNLSGTVFPASLSEEHPVTPEDARPEEFSLWDKMMNKAKRYFDPNYGKL